MFTLFMYGHWTLLFQYYRFRAFNYRARTSNLSWKLEHNHKIRCNRSTDLQNIKKKMCLQNLFSNSRQLIDKVIFLLFHCSFLPMLTFDGQYEKFHTLKTTHCPIWAAPKNDLTINECYENWKKILILSTISV